MNASVNNVQIALLSTRPENATHLFGVLESKQLINFR